ncbi:MAG TPA: class I SAM-dependent methyltransferase [Thermoanaerobaculia bacterium]|nr:class I SAM-dependent methyltransferase [Thermoanaerobaculia bacterium]
MDGSKTAQAVARYWDDNRLKSKDPTFWMAHPLCRQAINKRVSGSPNEWPLDWFKRVHVRRAYERGLSWGCGLGSFERAAVRVGLVGEIDAFDLSDRSLADARLEAEKEGITGINYQIGDFNNPKLESNRYDVVFFHASLHHVSSMERLFRRLAFSLKPRAAVYVDEYVGPSRQDWQLSDLGMAQALLDILPDDAKVGPTINPPIEPNDPSEAIRSSEIEEFLLDFVDLIDWKPYGGQLVDLVLPYVSHDWSTSAEGMRYVQSLLGIEDFELARRPSSSHYLVAFGTFKPLWRLGRPLGKQVKRAARRRLLGIAAALRRLKQGGIS